MKMCAIAIPKQSVYYEKSVVDQVGGGKYAVEMLGDVSIRPCRIGYALVGVLKNKFDPVDDEPFPVMLAEFQEHSVAQYVLRVYRKFAGDPNRICSVLDLREFPNV